MVIIMVRGNNAKSKYWCFTLNNFIPSEVIHLRGVGRVADLSTYLCYGREVGQSGTRHLQGYIQLRNRQRLSWVKNKIASRAHWEISRGSPDEAAQYCKKEGDFEEYGKMLSTRTGRTDLEAIKNEIAAGVSEEEIATKYFSQWCLHRRAFADYRRMLLPRRNWLTECFVLWGESGSGKTRYVHDNELDLWVASDNSLQWFDGYRGNEAVLFDDFVSCKANRFGFLLQLLDRYPLSVPVKGGFVPWVPKRIYFTSNLPIEQWFLGVTPGQMAALQRRITKTTHFSGF